MKTGIRDLFVSSDDGTEKERYVTCVLAISNTLKLYTNLMLVTFVQGGVHHVDERTLLRHV